MYIEKKVGEIVGPARIGLVTYSKTGKTIYYRGRSFASLNGNGFKANFFDKETREEYWISGCMEDGTDALYSVVIEIDEDVREEYWLSIKRNRNLEMSLHSKALASIRSSSTNTARTNAFKGRRA